MLHGVGGFHGEESGLSVPIPSSVSCLEHKRGFDTLSLTHTRNGFSTELIRRGGKQNCKLLGGLANSGSVLIKQKGKVENLGDSLKL